MSLFSASVIVVCIHGWAHSMLWPLKSLMPPSLRPFYSRPVACIPSHSLPLTALETAAPLEFRYLYNHHLQAYSLNYPPSSHRNAFPLPPEEILYLHPPAVPQSQHHAPIFISFFTQHQFHSLHPVFPFCLHHVHLDKSDRGQPSRAPLCLCARNY